MSRKYSISIAAVNVSTVPQDLFQISMPASKVGRLHEVRVNQHGSTTSAQVQVRISKLSATVTNGSGGSTPTINKMEDGDAASSATVFANNSTTQATSSGTKVTAVSDAFNVLAGWQYTPTPEDQVVIAPSCAVVVEIVSGTMTNADATAVWEEIG